MISKVKFHCTQKAETLLKLEERYGEGHGKLYEFMTKVQPSAALCCSNLCIYCM